MAKRGLASDDHLRTLVQKELKGDYAILTMNRPKVNAIDFDLLRALRLRIKELSEVDKVRGLILTGKPGIYSAGLDLPYLSSLARPQMEEWYDFFTDTIAEMVNSDLITIAAISGHSPAGGAVLALTTDYRIMAQGDYKIGLNEVAVSLEMPPGVAALAVSVLGQRGAEQVILTGRMWSVDEALELRMLDETVPLEELLPRSEQVLREWLDGSKERAVKVTKRSMRAGTVQSILAQKKSSKAWLDGWYKPETQAFLAKFKESLAKKSKL
jgi:3,2-trans-enoyl-CoA isomerase